MCHEGIHPHADARGPINYSHVFLPGPHSLIDYEEEIAPTTEASTNGAAATAQAGDGAATATADGDADKKASIT